MSEQPKKRYGPLTWLASRTWRFWVVVALPLLYIASSGPMLTVARRTAMGVAVGGPGTPDVPMLEIDVAEWWMRIYGPLLWLPEDSWGERFVWRYWSLFAEPGVAHARANPWPNNGNRGEIAIPTRIPEPPPN